MGKILFVQYPKCGTCQKAGKWLKENNITVDSRNISENNPTDTELTEWIEKSGLPINKFFNTSGKIYKEQNYRTCKERFNKRPYQIVSYKRDVSKTSYNCN